MDVLNHTARTRTGPWIVAVVVLLPFASCLIRHPERPTGPHFSHHVHVVERGLDCAFCHAGSASGVEAGMPLPELCAPCHDAIDAEKPESRRIAAFYDEDFHYVRREPVARLQDEIRFSHRTHTRQQGLACADCHGATGTSDFVTAESAVRKPDCMGCHAERSIDNACSTCHTVIDRSWRPPSHAGGSTWNHGDAFRFAEAGRSVDDCSLCHKRESDCQFCHQEVAPRDHDAYWRLRGHGISVALDRGRCEFCHRPDQCIRCHESTRPLSHAAGFGGRTSRHCTHCHFPLEATGCATCHRETPSHAFAAPLPPDHSPASNCRQCHGLTAPLPHPDGGHACTVCHH